jgi:hypothetical protein|tara:strand:- start:1549 stop:1860 length:312 start_codon:yes stop_codon:yes gene_type:complete
MKITKRRLRRIIREEKASLLKEYGPDFDLEIAAKELKSLQDDGSMDKIAYQAFEHAKIWSSASDALDIRLMDAGLHDLAMDMRQLIELLNKIRKTTGEATIQG